MTNSTNTESHQSQAGLFDSEFFPTPAGIAYKMIAKVSKDARHFLEPSAGKGDIADVIKGRNNYRQINVDCIEQSPDLTAILLDKGFPVVGHDWLEYSGVCYYDAIVMNPPFSNGDDHLLKAWDFLHAGEIVCLLNEDTIKNPYTAARKRLADIIDRCGEVEYLGDCFSSAQRKTGVQVAMVYLKKESEDDRIDLWVAEGAEKAFRDEPDADQNLPALIDNLGNMQLNYDKSNEHMLQAFQHLRKASLYMQANGVSVGTDYEKATALALGNVTSARAEFAKKHRRDSWFRVFEKMEFRKWLDKKQTDEFIRDIERNGNIPFTKENIKGTLENVFLQRKMLFEKSVANVFDELTSYFNGNTNHTEGWKTNDSYKVNQKIIFPWGCRFDGKYMNSFSMVYGKQIDIYNDLDRVLCVLDGKDFAECHTVYKAMDNKFHILGHDVKSPFDNTTESRYFEIKFFKKGTVHLTFKDKHLWERFNITAAAGKAVLGRQTQAT